MDQNLYPIFLKNLVPQQEPAIIAFGGAPGSGKSTWRRSWYSDRENVHLHDMDEVLIRLPGYQRDLRLEGPKKAFEKWWPVARETADTLVQYAVQSRYSILYDRTCGAEGSYFALLQAKKEGYRITLMGFCTDPDIAFARILQREKKEGRTVTREIFDEYRARFSALWPYYLSFVDEAFLYDTSEEAPKLIFSPEKIRDPKRYQTFLEEGDSFKSYFSEKIDKLQ